MVSVRAYTKSDGITYCEEMSIDAPQDALPGAFRELSATKVTLDSDPVGHSVEIPPGLESHYVVTLSGVGELSTTSGDVCKFGPGDVLLLGEVTGSGNTCRVVGDEPWLCLCVYIPD